MAHKCRLLADEALVSKNICKLCVFWLPSFSKHLGDSLRLRLAVEVDGENHVVGADELIDESSFGHNLLRLVDTCVVHRFIENNFVDHYAAVIHVLLVAKHLAALHERDGFIVASAIEDVADCEFCWVPEGLVLWHLRVDIVEAFTSTAQRENFVLENDAFNRAMVDLTLIILALDLKVDDTAASKIVLHLKHVACKSTRFTRENGLGEIKPLFIIGEIGRIYAAESLGDFCLFELLFEDNGEDFVSNTLQKLGKTSHVDEDLFLEVISAVHSLKNALRDLIMISKLIPDRNHVVFGVDAHDCHVGGHGHELVHLELLKVPLGGLALLHHLFDRCAWLSAWVALCNRL